MLPIRTYQFMENKTNDKICLGNVVDHWVGASHITRKISGHVPNQNAVCSPYFEHVFDVFETTHKFGAAINCAKQCHRSQCTVDTAYGSLKKYIDGYEKQGRKEDLDPLMYEQAMHEVEKRLPVSVVSVDPSEYRANFREYLSEPQASAGYPYILKSGSHKKGDVVETTEFQSELDKIHSAFRKMNCLSTTKGGYHYYRQFVSPCVAYQKSAIVKPGKDEKTRLIWGYPLDMTYLEGQFAAPWIEACKDREQQDPDSLTSFRMSAYTGGYRRLAEAFGDWNAMVADYSAYDTTVPSFLIVDVFDMIKRRTIFHSREQEVMFDAVVHYFINTPIIIGQTGTLFVKKHGIPSGSWFTNLVGSLCNAVMMFYANFTAGHRPIRMKVMGDDNLTVGGLHDAHTFSLKIGVFGVQVNPLKCYSGKLRHATYLGRQFCLNVDNKLGWSKPLSSTLLSLAFPSKVDDEVSFFQRLYALYIDNPTQFMWRLVQKYKDQVLHALTFDFSTEQNRMFIYNVFSGDSNAAKAFLKELTLLTPEDLLKTG